MHNYPEEDKADAYRKAVLKLLVSDRFCFGIPGVIDAIILVVRMWLCWLCVRSFGGVIGGLFDDGGDDLRIQRTMFDIVSMGLGLVGVHLWWGLGKLV